jgi:ketosteroid isomerase-like protein
MNMKRIFTLMLFLALSASTGLSQEKSATGTYRKDSTAAVKKHIIQLEEEWAAAERKADKGSLNKILADGYRFTDLNGKVGTKTEFLSNLQASIPGVSTGPERKTASDYEVSVYGDTAVVTHNAVFQAKSGDKDLTVEARGIDVWVKRGGNWQVVAHQWAVLSGPSGDSLPREFLRACARMSFQPEVHSLYGDATAVLAKLENDSMGLPDRRGYLLLVETENSAELVYYERVSLKDSKVYHWEGRSAGDLRERLTNFILANRGIACVGAQTKAMVNASLRPSDLGAIPTPLSATAAFSHMIRKYGNSYLRVSILLLC